jgi:hypothetical protein
VSTQVVQFRKQVAVDGHARFEHPPGRGAMDRLVAAEWPFFECVEHIWSKDA